MAAPARRRRPAGPAGNTTVVRIVVGRQQSSLFRGWGPWGGRAKLPAEVSAHLYGVGAVGRVVGTARDRGPLLLRPVAHLRELHRLLRLRLRHRGSGLSGWAANARAEQEQHGTAPQRPHPRPEALGRVPAYLRRRWEKHTPELKPLANSECVFL